MRGASAIVDGRGVYWAALGVMAFVGLISLGEMAAGNVWAGNWLWVSPSAFSTLFIACAILLRRQGLDYFQALLIALTTMVSMIWMYELFYHFGFFVDWGYAKPPWVFGDFNEAALTDILLISVGLVGLKFMRPTWITAVLFALFAGLFVVWVLMGYPQLASPGKLFPFGQVLIQVSDPAFWAYWLNVLTKYLLAFVYISLFAGRSRMSVEAGASHGQGTSP